ncbi:MAG: hypothetical protein IJL83_02685 [Clostridia bacterium]|nr:hypothetical protein [Clostridia bacterium]
MTKKNRVIATVLAVVFALAVALSLVFIAAEADHDCSGEDCPVCELLALCRGVLRGVLAAAFVCLAAAALRTAALSRSARSALRAAITPASLKVKLLN